MKTQFSALVSRTVLVAGLGLAAVAAQAAGGMTVKPQDESKVQVGMTRSEVQAALGRPARDLNFVRSGTQTWRYNVATAAGPFPAFEVDFGGDGRVVGTQSSNIAPQ